MNRSLVWKLVLVFLIVFVAGGMTGAFFYSSYARQVMFAPLPRGMVAERIRERMRRELKLTPEQLEKISPIIDKTAAQLEQIRRETGQRIREVVTDAHHELAPSLTEEQRAKLNQLEERQSKWRHHFRDRGHRHHKTPNTPERSAAPDSES